MRSRDLEASPTSIRQAVRLRARLVGACAAAGAAIALGGCSVSYPLFGQNEDLKTGSIAEAPPPATALGRPDAVSKTPLAPPPGAAAAVSPSETAKPAAYATAGQDASRSAITPDDWAYARGALSLAMGADAVNASVPWANPDTGSYGSFSASAGTVAENGSTCRPFAASHSGGGHEQRLEGTACRTAAGHWEAVAIRTTASRTL